MHLAILLNFTLSLTQLYFFKPFFVLLVFWISIMCNLIGGQLDERLNAFLATCHVVICIIMLLLVILVANKMMMMICVCECNSIL